MAEDLVTIRNFQFLPEAEAARMHLEVEGITAFIADGETVNMDWLLGNAIGYVKLQVAARQADTARAVLDQLPGRQGGGERPNQEVETSCLACGAEFPTGATTCPACGWTYTDADADAPVKEPLLVAGNGSSDVEGTASAMEFIRSWKRPFIWLYLGPVLFFAVLGMLYLIGSVIKLLFG